MLTAQMDSEPDQANANQANAMNRHLPAALLSSLSDSGEILNSPTSSNDISILNLNQNNKFQGEIYFGLFQGVKVLNHGFGDRISHISG